MNLMSKSKVSLPDYLENFKSISLHRIFNIVDNKFMQILTYLIIISSVLFSACQTSTRLPTSHAPQSQNLYFEEFRNSWPDYALKIKSRKSNKEQTSWQDQFSNLCQSDDTLCEYGRRGLTKSLRYTRNEGQLLFKSIDNKNFADINRYPLSFSLTAFKNLKEPKLMSFANHLLEDTSCQSVDSRHALAATLENYLPSQEVLSNILDLYELNSKCEMSKTVALSSYRAAILRVVDNRCDVAIPLFDKVNSSAEDYLKARSYYWKWNCLGQSAEVKSEAQSVLPYFSYHRLVLNQYSLESIKELDTLKDQTPFQTYSKDENLTKMAQLIEELIVEAQWDTTRHLFEQISMKRLQSAEPEFQMYWAYLMHLSQSGVRKFQILSRLINERPEYRTQTVKSMLFPTWYFGSVSQYTSQVDPWLIQSLIRQESAFDPRARSRVGATGLMQLMPATARIVARQSRPMLKDPDENVKLGVKFFEKLLDRYDGEIHLALAAYNAGPLKVDRWIQRYPTQNPLLFVDAIPYRETREYVAFIMRNYYWYKFLNQSDRPGPLLSEQKSNSNPTSLE
jgi:soluble lytic murein transglycosylase